MDKEKLIYHHSRVLEHVKYGVVKQERGVDEYYEDCYLWLEKQVGFYPLFLSVGETEEDIRMTGYQNQWLKKIGSYEYRKKGEYPNYVLFSFDQLNSGVFMDYEGWHLCLNSSAINYQIRDWAKRHIFKYSWNKGDWLRYARKNPHSVQYVVPELDLSKANKVYVRNQATKKYLPKLGFKNINILRLKVGFDN